MREGGAVIAEEDDELTFEQKIIHSILGGGSGAGIDYRERSPLVIPPRVPRALSGERLRVL